MSNQSRIFFSETEIYKLLKGFTDSGTGAKQPFYFHLKDKEVFGFAGLYEHWLDRETGEQIGTCTIITTEANRVLEPIHDRMPIILQPNDYDQWLDAKEKDTDKLEKLLTPYPTAEMDLYKIR